MSEQVLLSDTAIAVCKANYGKIGSGCGRCPIQAQCCSGPTGRLTDDAMNAWRNRVNEAAETATRAAA